MRSTAERPAEPELDETRAHVVTPSPAANDEGVTVATGRRPTKDVLALAAFGLFVLVTIGIGGGLMLWGSWLSLSWLGGLVASLLH